MANPVFCRVLAVIQDLHTNIIQLEIINSRSRSGGDSDHSGGVGGDSDHNGDSDHRVGGDSDHSGGDSDHNGDSDHSGGDSDHGDDGWETISEDEDSNGRRVLTFKSVFPLSSRTKRRLNSLKKSGRGRGGRCLGKRMPILRGGGPGGANLPNDNGIRPSDYNFIRDPSFKPLEKTLTLFAALLAVIEKVASGLGKIAFVWATVVLLGGLASDLKPKDFWIITTIIVVESARLFTNSRELEWLHQSTRILPTNISHRSILPLTTTPRHRIADSAWIYVTKNTSCLLYGLQILTAAACMGLSLMRLGQQDYGDAEQINNKKSSLNVFYSLALIEAIMLLLEKLTWRIKCKKLIDRVSDVLELNKDFELNPTITDSLHCFFYNAYSQCIDGSIFDGLKMDLVSFAEKILDSDSPDEHIIGARILEGLVKKEQFASNTLVKIGNSTRVVEKLLDSDSPKVHIIGARILEKILEREEQFAANTLGKSGNPTRVIERLIEMLNWENAAEEDIRSSASKIVLKLVSSKHHAIRVAMIPGAMESIASLLNLRELYMVNARKNELPFNHLGLLILKQLLENQVNCSKFMNEQGLLVRIINLTNPILLREPFKAEPKLLIMIARDALRVLKFLAHAMGQAGNMLRRDILDHVYLARNIRELLEGEMILVKVNNIIMEDGRFFEESRISAEHCESLAELQKLGLEILTILGSNSEGREKIGAAGCMLSLIIKLFFQADMHEHAGEALVMLIFESERNCERILREGDVVTKLVNALEDEFRMKHAMFILTGLCAYSAPEQSDRLRIVAKAMPMVLKTIMKHAWTMAASIGLATQMLKYINAGDFENVIEGAGITDEQFVKKLVFGLRYYASNSSFGFYNTNRDVIELAIGLMKYEGKYIELFRNLGMKQVLIRAAEKTSELDCFNIISGSVGFSRHQVMISSLVDIALELLDEG